MFNLTKRNDRALNPWSVFQDEMMDIFDRFGGDLTTTNTGVQFIPKIDIKDQGNAYLVTAEVPGMSDKDINVTLRENSLILEGEKKNEVQKEDKGLIHKEISYGSFYRAIPLAAEVDADQVNATYKDGVLLVTLQKLHEAQRTTKRIPINSGSVQGKVVEAEQKH
ncbi:MAG TPA: Hsp20/alpha crystallin family protein [Bacteriovoracaceae bacterium]|nr:Hsp20/alpha crystallin family protein [Bacteriovoracaceae bacterium]